MLVPSLWRVQARWWKRHTPALDQLGAKHPMCGHCGQSWPCHSWACWDGQLGQAVGGSIAATPILPNPVPEAPARTAPVHTIGGTVSGMVAAAAAKS